MQEKRQNKKILVILAAGIGARFGTGIKQLEPVGPTDELIIDYSVHDAILAGFNKIVYIIRHDIEKDFRERIGNRVEKVCDNLGVEVVYAFQEKNMIVESVPEGRVKPWGTGHAVLCAADQIDGAFAVINADDYYGKDGFAAAASFLNGRDEYGLIGYVLKNTLSNNGGVTRGICAVENGKLSGISETKNIFKVVDSDGTVWAESDGKRLDSESIVSMNFWCFPVRFLDVLSEGFPAFVNNMQDPLKEEYLLPVIADGMLKNGIEFTVLPSNDRWFGVTYQEDKASVAENFKKLYEDGVYQKELYGDLM